jgi:formylglycine-generating enzyme required for sulfatase activity
MSFGIMAKAPAGTLPLPGMNNAYLDKTEVTNVMWREYMAYVKTHPEEFDSSAYLRSYPDLEQWHRVYPDDFDRKNRFDHHPVVGVNYPQVVNFCKWRSKDISEKRKQKIVYTLPSILEYQRAAKRSKPLLEGLYSVNLDIAEFVGLCDNAHEMTLLEGLAMTGYGGNCMDTLFFSRPAGNLGFRCKAYFK